ncbi:hypothetical protein ILUMI_13996, partial [Ignelater luminosus]
VRKLYWDNGEDVRNLLGINLCVVIEFIQTMKFLQHKVGHGGQDDRVKAISVSFEAPIYSLPKPEVSCHESMSTTTIMDVNNTFVESPFDLMINDLPVEKKALPLQFYFDNLFTSPKLLVHLRNLGYSGTGTIQDNRVLKNCPLTSIKDIKKNNRGEYGFALDKKNLF